VGPVSFESLDGGVSRVDALAAATRLADAGIRVVQLDEPQAAGSGRSDGGRFRIVVRSADAARAREVLAQL